MLNEDVDQCFKALKLEPRYTKELAPKKMFFVGAEEASLTKYHVNDRKLSAMRINFMDNLGAFHESILLGRNGYRAVISYQPHNGHHTTVQSNCPELLARINDIKNYKRTSLIRECARFLEQYQG